MKIVLALIASAMLSTGCCKSGRVIPDATVPHQVATEACVEVWARRPDGAMERVKVRLPVGWWIAGPPVVEAR